MKSLNQYIKESLDSNALNDIKDWSEETIDEFIQQGIVGFDKKDWEKYIKGEKHPDFVKIVDAMLTTYNDTIGTRFGQRYRTFSGRKAIDLLANYKDNKEVIDDIILKAAKIYLIITESYGFDNSWEFDKYDFEAVKKVFEPEGYEVECSSDSIWILKNGKKTFGLDADKKKLYVMMQNSDGVTGQSMTSFRWKDYSKRTSPSDNPLSKGIKELKKLLHVK